MGVEELAPPAKKFNRGRGRPPLTVQQRTERQALKAAAARSDIIIVSITVVNKRQEIERSIFDTLFTWVQSQPAGGLALERGGTYGHLHIQGVAKVLAVTPQQVNKQIKDVLADKLTESHSVCVKKLTGRGLHTWHGMIGYIHKDARLPHFEVQLHNITEADVEVALAEYLKWGAGSVKKCTALTARNIFEKAKLFQELHLKGTPMGLLNFQRTLLEMLKTGKYYPVGWMNPYGGKGLNHDRADAQWRIMNYPDTVQPEDVHKVFFWGGEYSEYPATGRPLHDSSEARLQRVLERFFQDSQPADMPLTEPASCAAAAAEQPPRPHHQWDDGGLGDALGPNSGFRAAAVDAEHEQFWRSFATRMAAMEEASS